MIGDDAPPPAEGDSGPFDPLDDEARARYAAVIGPDTLAVLVVSFDADSGHGWRAQSLARPWLTAAMFARLIREAANVWDPPVAIKFAADHAPDCDCGHCPEPPVGT